MADADDLVFVIKIGAKVLYRFDNALLRSCDRFPAWICEHGRGLLQDVPLWFLGQVFDELPLKFTDIRFKQPLIFNYIHVQKLRDWSSGFHCALEGATADNLDLFILEIIGNRLRLPESFCIQRNA